MSVQIGSPDGSRGVSDVLAFTIVFSIIITSTALVYGVGFSSLTHLRDGEQNRNAQFAFQALNDNFDDVVRSDVPGRAGEISLSGGQLTVRNGTRIERVSVAGVPEYNNSNAGYAVGSLEYSYEDTVVSLEGGTVFRSDNGHSTVHGRPPFSCLPERDRAVVSIVTLSSTENGIGADGSVQIVAREESSSLIHPSTTRSAWVPNGTGPEVTVEMSGSQHSEAWKRAMEDAGWDSNAAGTEFTCDLGEGDGDGGVVYVRRTVVDIVFRT